MAKMPHLSVRLDKRGDITDAHIYCDDTVMIWVEADGFVTINAHGVTKRMHAEEWLSMVRPAVPVNNIPEERTP